MALLQYKMITEIGLAYAAWPQSQHGQTTFGKKIVLGVSVMKGSYTMELEVIPGFTGWTCTWIAAKFLKGNKKVIVGYRKWSFIFQT